MHAAVPKLLLIEDDPLGAEASQALFEFWGYAVTVASTAADGLVLAQSAEPQVIVMDLGLPAIEHGVTLVRAIRAARAADPPVVVALTGYGRETDRRRALDAGADLFFVKPADLDDLKRALANACRRGRKGPRAAGRVPG